MASVELVGADTVLKILNNLVSQDMRPMILRDIARKPALTAANRARDLMPIGDTGKTARTIGILKVKNPKWTFVEVGFRGRSLGHIYMSGSVIKRRKRGSVKGFPWLFEKTGSTLRTSLRQDLKVDITKVFIRAFKKKGMGT